MKLKFLALCLMLALLCTGCASGASAGDSVGAVDTAYTLSEEQMEMLGISQEEFEAMSEDEKAETMMILDQINAALEAEKAAEAEPTPAPEESQEINPEEDVQKYLEKLPPLPSGDPEYGYEWSDRLDRVTYYDITIDPASYDEINDFMYKLETEYGYMSDGKEEWDPETDTSRYGYNTDTSYIYVSVTPNPDGTVKVVISISYNPNV